jgi:hypothetical protein
LRPQTAVLACKGYRVFKELLVYKELQAYKAYKALQAFKELLEPLQRLVKL